MAGKQQIDENIRASSAINTKLREQRAKAVVKYLFQQGSALMRHTVAPVSDDDA
jgi:hypothetical protein